MSHEIGEAGHNIAYEQGRVFIVCVRTLFIIRSGAFVEIADHATEYCSPSQAGGFHELHSHLPPIAQAAPTPRKSSAVLAWHYWSGST